MYPEYDRVVIKVKVRVGKVIMINNQNHQFQKTWHDHGFQKDSHTVHCRTLRTTDTNMNWAEDDFDPPPGTFRLGLSKPVDGRTYVMYHGTTRACAEDIQKSGFQQSSDGMLGRGVYLSRDLQKASRYPIDHPESDRVVIKVLVQVGKVIAINDQKHPLQKIWHDHWYDTAWVPPGGGMVPSGLEEDCVWDPARIQIIKIINPT
ncbi:unnamed protein product [Pleuronectes platessa]|uniref:PARP catalytic domain-containing protein n=1 Tax=Pleuronectes platessa TaxID=8262 RepID=A0A9N7TI67_PLEPL|nr:unnamed protein product [Pleuronectes platessa]